MLQRAAVAALGLLLGINRGPLLALPILLVALRDGRGWMRTSVDAPLLVLVVWLIAAGLRSQFSPYAVLIALLWALAVCLFFQAPYRWFRARPDLTGTLSRWIALGVVCAVAIALYTVLGAPGTGGSAPNRLKLAGSPAPVLAWTLEVGMLMGLGAFDRHPWLVVAALAVGTVGLIETLTRWATLGFACGLATWTLLVIRRRRRHAVIVLGTVILALAAAISLPLTQAIMARQMPQLSAGNRWGDALRLGFLSPVALAERRTIWSTTLRMIADHPWFGVGPGAFASAYTRYFDPATAPREVLVLPSHGLPAYTYGPHAHNEFLTVAATAGIPAALAYAAILLLALRGAASRRDPYGPAAAAALLAIIVNGLFDAVSTGFAAPLAAFWTVVAVAVQPSAEPPGAERETGRRFQQVSAG